MKAVLVILCLIFICIVLPYVIALALPSRKWLIGYAILAILFGLYVLSYHHSDILQKDLGHPVGVDISITLWYAICSSAIIGAIAKLKYIALKKSNKIVHILQNPIFIGIFLVPVFAMELYFAALGLVSYFLYLILQKHQKEGKPCVNY